MYSFHNRDITVRLKVKKNKIAIVIVLVLVMLFALGCSGNASATTTPERSYEIVKVTKVKSKDAQWEIYHLHLVVEGGGKFTIDLNLNDGDKVDWWYNVEKPSTGGNIDFQIKAGANVIYTSTSGTTTTTNTSDRYWFTASQADGTSYRLIFQNTLPDRKSKETIFIELIYPSKTSGEDSIFIPIDAN
jgi:hypothetical protein